MEDDSLLGTDGHGSFAQGFYRPQIILFYLTRPLLLGEVPSFSKTPPSPLNLKRGSTSPPAPSPQERAPTGKPAVLYSQTSSRPCGVARDYLRNRVAII